MKPPIPNRTPRRVLLAAATLLSGGPAPGVEPSLTLEAILSKPGPDGDTELRGSPVSVSGDTLLCAGPEADTISVFVRQGTEWTWQAALRATRGEPSDAFGWSQALSGDTAVVGAPGEDSNSTGVNGDPANNRAIDSGAAYVFERRGTEWTQVAYLKASRTRAGANLGGGYYGTGVAVSGDTIVVGARLDGTRARGAGAAFVYVRGEGGWAEQAVLYPSNPGQAGQFGDAVAISGDTIVVGAHYESSDATGVNGNQSNTRAQGSGAAYVFVRQGTSWTQEAYLKASNTETYDDFGIAVAVSGDTVAIGAPGEDSDFPGVNGEQGNVGSDGLFNSGAIYVFGRSDGTWTQRAYLKSDDPQAGDQFGSAVGVTGSVVVGGTYPMTGGSASKAHVFAHQGTEWSHFGRLDRDNSGSPNLFSWAVSASGRTVAVSHSVFTGLPVFTPPRLTIAPAGAGVRLSWPLDAEGWLLESTAAPEAGSWTVVPAPYERDAAGFHHPLPEPGGRGFFRLRRP